MIQKEYGGYTLSCDICGYFEDFDTFDEAVDYKKTHGWRSRKNEFDEWVDECRRCSAPATALEDFE